MLVSRSTIPVLPLLIVATGVVGAVLLVIAYPGSDTEAGFAGNQCHGLPVTDTRPGPGNDNLTGTSGDDVVDLQEGNDAYDGGGGNDTIRGGKGNDDLDGQGRSDDVFGNKGSDDVSGGGGDSDLAAGGAESDEVSGNPAGATSDTFEGGTAVTGRLRGVRQRALT